jgi:hypothetical protein
MTGQEESVTSGHSASLKFDSRVSKRFGGEQQLRLQPMPLDFKLLP